MKFIQKCQPRVSQGRLKGKWVVKKGQILVNVPSFWMTPYGHSGQIGLTKFFLTLAVSLHSAFESVDNCNILPYELD